MMWRPSAPEMKNEEDTEEIERILADSANTLEPKDEGSAEEEEDARLDSST